MSAKVSPELSAKRRAAVQRRWGPPRVIRLDGLSPDQARLIRALVDAARAMENETKPA